MAKDRVIVIGAGMGGLSAALLLAARGLDVTLLERAAAPGGKMRLVHDGAHGIDAGPTVFTLKRVFEEIFAGAGLDFDAHVRVKRASILARHAWGRGARFDLHADIDQSADEIAQFFNPREAAGFRAFCAESARIWRTVEGPVVRAERASLLGLILGAGVKGLPDLLATSPFESMWKALGRHFQDPRLRQLFGRYATYCGSSPFLSPATLMLIAHVEQDGVWMVDGGMHALAQAFATAAQSKGARIHYGAHVQKILREGSGFVVETAKGETFHADKIIFNGDANALAQGSLGSDLRGAAPAVAPSNRSLSAVTCTFATRTSGFPLVRHNVFFSDDYPAEFAALQSGSLDYDPTVYVCAQDRGDDDTQQDTPERLLLLVNAPAFGDHKSLSDAEIDQCMMRMMRRVEACGLQIDKEPERRHIATPQDFNQLFPATGGAIYGRPTHGWRATFTRPGVRSKIPNLYLTGGSVHPGAGIPMAALSGLTAAACLMQDRTSR